MLQIFQYLLIIFTVVPFNHAKIGDLTVKKINLLIINQWQQEQCEAMLPYAANCDNSYKVVDDYCQEYAQRIDKNCDHLYSELKNRCNKAEFKIKYKCTSVNGFITARCGRKFERLGKVCGIQSESISKSCTHQYKKMDKRCYLRYGKTDIKCNKIYEQYEDMCEGKLNENIWYDEEIEDKSVLDEIENQVDEIKKLIELNNNEELNLNIEKNEKELNNDIKYKRSLAKKYNENLERKQISAPGKPATLPLTVSSDPKSKKIIENSYKEFEDILESNVKAAALKPTTYVTPVPKNKKPNCKSYKEDSKMLKEYKRQKANSKKTSSYLSKHIEDIKKKTVSTKNQKLTRKSFHEKFQSMFKSGKKSFQNNLLLKETVKKNSKNEEQLNKEINMKDFSDFHTKDSKVKIVMKKSFDLN